MHRLAQILNLILILFASISFGQNTSNYLNNWHLGSQVGLNFTGGAASLAPSAISAQEVSASWSDGSGNNMFYIGADNLSTGGNSSVIWDASHTLMPNGDIDLDFSSTAGLAIAPVPGNCDQFYVFHLASTGPGWGLHYSVVDMTLPGNGTVPLPLGDVVPGQKDVLVYGADNLAEKIKIVQKGNTEDYWVITRSITTDSFYAFEVTSAGVSTTPVTSVISGTTWPTVIGSPILSWLAVNKDRNVIAEANGLGASVLLYSFDNLTGVLTLEEQILTGVLNDDIPYGLEFSPSGNYLYTSWVQGATNTLISGWDMTAGFGSIAGTRQDYTIATSGGAQYGGLTRAPDGKIYGSRFTNVEFLEIQTPENLLAPNVVSPGLDPSPNSLEVGMPNVTYYFHPDNYVDTLAGNDRTICPNDQAELGAIGYDSIWVNYTWEPAAMIAGSVNEATPMTVPLTADQQYIVHLVTACGDTVNSDTSMVFITSSLSPGIDTSITVCDNMLAFDLLEFMGGNPDNGGVFSPALVSGDTIYDPLVDGAGVFTYTQSGTCGGVSNTTINVIACPDCNNNLVPNPSFESLTQCPDNNNGMPYVLDWDKPATGSTSTGTSDYYNTCGYHTIQPNTGNGYAGFITYVNFIPNAREYVQVQLNSPLLAGDCYEASMYIALDVGSGYAHDSIGMYFTNTAIPSPGGNLINGSPQVASTVVIDDTLWTQVTGTFTAVGGEEFLTIGVFTGDANLNVTSPGAGIGAKYLVDDVCVIHIPEDTIYTPLMNDTALCDIVPITLTAPSGFGKYYWTDNLNNSLGQGQSKVIDPTLYSQVILQALDTTICPHELNIDTINISIDTISAGVTSNSPICENQTLNLSASPSGLGFGNYSWVGPNGPMAAQLGNLFISPFPNPIPGGYFTVTVTNGICSDTDSVLVISNPTYAIANTIDICTGSDYTYADGTVSNNITVNESHISSLLTTEGCDSIVTEDLNVVVTPVPTAGTTATYCDGDVMTDLTATAGSGGTLNWYDDAGLTNNIGTGGILTPGTTIGTTTYYLTETVNGCESLPSIVDITITPTPAAPVAGTDATYCEGDVLLDLTATAGSGGTLNWYDDAGLTNNLGSGGTLAPSSSLGTITYYVTETVGGCQSAATSITITINPGSAPQITTASDFCITDDSTAFVGIPNGGVWSGQGIINSTTGMFDPNVAGQGSHYVYYANSGGCGGTDSIQVYVFANPTASFFIQEESCFGLLDGVIQTINVTGQSPFDYSWSDGSTDDNLIDLGGGIYDLTITDDNNCFLDTSLIVPSENNGDCEFHIWVPNVFSPDGNGENDVLYARGKGVSQLSFQVFNRWGEMVFVSSSVDVGWDGTFKGKPLNAEVFVWRAVGTFVDGSDFNEKGNVTLVR